MEAVGLIGRGHTEVFHFLQLGLEIFPPQKHSLLHLLLAQVQFMWDNEGEGARHLKEVSRLAGVHKLEKDEELMEIVVGSQLARLTR